MGLSAMLCGCILSDCKRPRVLNTQPVSPGHTFPSAFVWLHGNRVRPSSLQTGILFEEL